MCILSPTLTELQNVHLMKVLLEPESENAFWFSQIPAMAVEMPGSTDISGLNLQFGALQFGSEPVLPEYESTPATTTPVNQVQNSLYTSPSRLAHASMCKLCKGVVNRGATRCFSFQSI